jgi:hypothetical protein
LVTPGLVVSFSMEVDVHALNTSRQVATRAAAVRRGRMRDFIEWSGWGRSGAGRGDAAGLKVTWEDEGGCPC